MPERTLDAIARAKRLKRQKEGNRTARVELRLTPEEKAQLDLKAFQTRRTVSSILIQLIDEMDKIIP